LLLHCLLFLHCLYISPQLHYSSLVLIMLLQLCSVLMLMVICLLPSSITIIHLSFYCVLLYVALFTAVSRSCSSLYCSFTASMISLTVSVVEGTAIAISIHHHMDFSFKAVFIF
jgi:hypothetical protein